jgi:Na+/H+-dicarboxylate symporter
LSGASVISDDPTQRSLWRKIPLYIRILAGVALGIAVGIGLGEPPRRGGTVSVEIGAKEVIGIDTKFEATDAGRQLRLAGVAKLIKVVSVKDETHLEIEAFKGAAALSKVRYEIISPDALPVRLGEMGMLIIQLLKALATPLILFAVLDAFVRTHIPAKQGLRLLMISAVNAIVAITIGLGVANVLHSGDKWKGHLDSITDQIGGAQTTEKKDDVTLNPLKNIASYVPQNLVDPFQKNSVITVVALAVLGGAALRQLKNRGSPETRAALEPLEKCIQTIMQMFVIMLEWIIQIIPFAVFGVVAKVVGETGAGVFGMLGVFLATVLTGLFIHAVIYYSIVLVVVGKTSPKKFYTGSMDAIVTALSCGSSLATLPVTLKCLNDKLKVSPASARLAACVGTNLNHDGIILYEAAATIFIAQVLGIDLTVGQQVTIAFASIMAGIGIAGVPEAGLITLPLVLGAAGLPEAMVLTVIPLLLPVDWIIGRCRAATNVISDMTVATLLDRFDPPEAVIAPPVPEEVAVK